MPGNQDINGEIELKVSYMVKRSQGKSALGAVNFKKRVFVLTASRLTYFDGTLEVCDIKVVTFLIQPQYSIVVWCFDTLPALELST